MTQQKYWLVDMKIPKGSDKVIEAKKDAVVMETTAADEGEEAEAEETTEAPSK